MPSQGAAHELQHGLQEVQQQSLQVPGPNLRPEAAVGESLAGPLLPIRGAGGRGDRICGRELLPLGSHMPPCLGVRLVPEQEEVGPKGCSRAFATAANLGL